MRKNIAAFTESSHSMPSYISVNSEDGKISITVRTRGDKSLAEIEMSAEQLESLATDILAEINKETVINKQPDISKFVDRFLGWQLPKDFCPDAGISFKPTKPDGYGTPWWPVGTNLLTADQARQMFEHVLSDEPASQQKS